MVTRMDELRLLLVDDHPAIREAVRRRLEAVPRVKEVREAGDIPEARRQLCGEAPDVAVIDIGLGKESGLLLAREVRDRYPETRVLIWSMYNNADYVAEANAVGARGYVLKSRPTLELVKAVGVVADGGRYYSAGIEQPSIAKPDLTLREKQVIERVASGRSSPEIAKQLKIDVRTVETHRRNIASKLGVKNTAELIMIGIRLGLISPLD